MSLNSFATENEGLIARSTSFHKTANYINKIKNPESEFVTSFNFNQEKSLQDILKNKSNQK